MYSELRGRLIAKKITREDLAVKLHRCKNYIDRFFCGRGDITLSEAYAIMDILDLSHDKFPKYFPNGGVS